jgi:serine protease
VVGNLTIQGSITTPAFAFIDGDTNDPNNPREGNNRSSATDFQTIANPAAVGGYLGQTEQGFDVEDWFAVALAAGQGATLFVADPIGTDFDLFLVDGNGDIVDSSLGISDFESVTAPAGGDYFVVVTSCLDENCSTLGPGNYNLTIGTGLNDPTSTSRVTAHHEFVEGHVLISEGDEMRAPKAATRDGWRKLGETLDLRAERRAPVVELWNVRRRPGVTRPKTRVQSTVASMIDWSPTLAAVKALRRSGTESASPNYMRRAAAVPNDEYYQFQWHYPLIGLEQAWDISTGDGVTVAVIDTGIVSSHPDFAGQLVGGYDYISDPNRARDGDGVDPNPEDVGDLGQNGQGSSFHGTHVAGTVAARTNNGQGVAGVAWGASILSVRALGVGGGTTYDTCQAMLFAAGLPNDANSGASPPADVINMSLGGGPISQCEVDAIDQARARGIFVVVAAGNENMNSDNISLGGIEAAFTVSAVEATKQKSSYSNFGSKVDVAAPGGETSVDLTQDGWPDGVLSTLADDAGALFYDFYQGTSMASPHMAGVVALMKAANPSITPSDLDLLLQGNHPGTNISIVEDLGAPGKDDVYGYGLIDALGAVRAASELEGVVLDEPLIQVSPRSLELTSAQPSASLSVRNAGAGQLTVTQVTTDQPWLQVNPTSGTEGPYQVTADVGGLADGIYLGAVLFESNGGSASVSVRASVGAAVNPVGGGEVGTLYVLLVNDQYDSLAQAVTSSSEGYRYTISGVAPGTYAVFAGTDYNNDGAIDDAGEALGGYPTLTDPVFVEVDDSAANVDFFAGFTTRLFAGSKAVRAGQGAVGPPVGALKRE